MLKIIFTLYFCIFTKYSNFAQDLNHLCHDEVSLVMISGNGSVVIVTKNESVSGMNCIKNNTRDECIHMDNDINFYLITRRNPSNRQKLVTGNADILEKSYFNKSLNTKFLLHGWREFLNDTEIIFAGKAILERHDYNVIWVDWSKYSQIWYTLSEKYIKHVSKQVGDFVMFLIDSDVEPRKIHLIGYSLGAHIASRATEFLQGNKIGQLTGLDAAVPLICDDNLTQDIISSNITKKQAIFVNIIHTSMFGIRTPVGHIDFYPDGGLKQDSCEMEDTILMLCSHKRAAHYYMKTIVYYPRYIGVKCVSFEEMENKSCSGHEEMMGFGTPASARGIFYVGIGKNWQRLPGGKKSVATKIGPAGKFTITAAILNVLLCLFHLH